jgi:hypothetical protein
LGSGGVTPRILDLGIRWRWVVSFMPRPLYLQGKSPWYPLERRLGVPQNRSGRGEEKNSHNTKNCSVLPAACVSPVESRSVVRSENSLQGRMNGPRSYCAGLDSDRKQPEGYRLEIMHHQLLYELNIAEHSWMTYTPTSPLQIRVSFLHPNEHLSTSPPFCDTGNDTLK